MPWVIVDATVEGDCFIVLFSNGLFTIEAAAEIAFLAGRMAVLRGLHLQGPGPNTVGPTVLYSLVGWVKAELGVEQLRIEGANSNVWGRSGT